MFCTKCGAIIRPGKNFCSNCGNSLNPSNEQKRDSHPVRKKQLTVGLIALVIILLSLTTVVVIQKRKPSEERESESVPQTTEVSYHNYEELILSELYVILGCDKEPKNLLVNAIYQNFSVEIKSVVNQDEKDVAECVFRNKNFASAVKEIESGSETISYAEYQSCLIDALSRQSELETTEQLIFSEKDGALVVTLTEQQLDNATGGLLTYYYNAYSGGD